MKKKYLTWAGIIAGGLLAILFLGILLTGTFTFFTTVTIDPIHDVNNGDLMIITGTTNLPVGTELSLDIVHASPASDQNSAKLAGSAGAIVVRGSGLTNTWSGAVDTTDISPGEYRVNVHNHIITNALNGSYTYGDLLATSPFTMNSVNATPAELRNLRANQTPFIAVNSLDTKRIGDKFLVTGTTSLPPDTELLYAVIQQSNISIFTIDPKTREKTEQGGLTVTGLIYVIPGTEGINRWSFALDTTKKFIPDHYRVVVTLENTSSENIGKVGIFGTTSLIVEDISANSAIFPSPGAGSSQFITVDNPGTRRIGEQLMITGTTKLPAGDKIMVSVYPSITSDYTVVIDPRTGSQAGQFSGAVEEVTVVRGTGDINLWSTMVNTATFRPTEYEVNASTFSKNPETRDIIFGNVSGTTNFILRG